MPEDDEIRTALARAMAKASGPAPAYHRFTTRHDKEVNLAWLHDAFGPPDPKAWEAPVAPSAAAGWRSAALRAAADALPKFRRRIGRAVLRDCTAAILLDLSGSMRGINMLLAATVAEVIDLWLERLEIDCEILGFTTREWHGGKSARDWAATGRPPHPGRLNDLLHVVLRRSSDKDQSRGAFLAECLRPKLLKENIDGEAVEWALRRLRGREQNRRVLFVVSDGAPMDDTTALYNGPDYLCDHLRKALEKAVSRGDVSIGAVGVHHDCSGFYARAATVLAPENIGPAAWKVFETTLSAAASQGASDRL